MLKIKTLLEKTSYELLIFCVLIFGFLTGRALDLDTWSAAFNLIDYSDGFGSRMLIGSIYHFFYGEYLDYSVVYKCVAIGIMLTIAVLSVLLGQLLRKALHGAAESRNAILGTVVLYVIAPFSISYTWNEQNLGRLDVYLLLVTALSILAILLIRNFYARIILVTLLCVVGLAIHQGFAFLYYPLILALLCFDVFEGNRVHIPYLAASVVSVVAEAAAAIFFQFFGWVNYESASELYDALSSRTNLKLSDWPVDIEYFQGIDYQLRQITTEFYRHDHPFLQTAVILLLLFPVVCMYFLVWRDVFYHLKHVVGG